MTNETQRDSLRLALGLAARLAAYALVVGLSLQAVVLVAAAGDLPWVVSEDGPVEVVQCSLAFASAALLVISGMRERGSVLLVVLGLACAFAGFRELDGLLRERLAPGSWKLFATPVVLAAVAVAWRGRARLPGDVAELVGTPASWLLFFGATLILVHAQVLGQKELWYALLPQPDARTVKKAFEECSEMTGYLLLLAGAIEARLRSSGGFQRAPSRSGSGARANPDVSTTPAASS